MTGLEETLRDTVQSLADEAPLAVGLAGTARVRGRRIRRRRHAVTGALALGVLSIVAVPYGWLRQQPPAPVVVQPAPTPSVTVTSSIRSLPSFDVKKPYRLPGGAVVSRMTIPSTIIEDGAQVPGPDTLVSLDRATGRYRELPFDHRPVAMSPDGERFAAGVGRNRVIVLDAQGTRLATLNVETYARIGGDPVWSPDGSRLLVPTEGGFTVYETRTGKHRDHEQPGIEPRCSDLCSFSWLPNGREFAVSREDVSGPQGESVPDRIESMDVYSADTGALVRRIPMTAVPLGGQAWSPDGTSVLVREERGVRVMDAVTGTPRGEWMPGPEAIYLDDGRILTYGNAAAWLYTADGTLVEEVRLPAQFTGLTIEVARN